MANLTTPCLMAGGWTSGSSLIPDVLVKVAIDRKNRIIYAKQGMWGYNHGTRELYDKVKAVVKPREVVIADSSEKRLIADMKGLGLNIRKVRKRRRQRAWPASRQCRIIRWL